MRKQIRYGMVGGDLNAFIGGVHRNAIAMDDHVTLVAGCFNPDLEINKSCGQHFSLDESRVYDNYQEMAEYECKREDKIDFVSIVTPNFLHYEIAKKFIESGINIVCEKPLCFTIDQALELSKLAKDNNILFAVTYTYSGYTMIKQAKEMIRDGEIGKIINVSAEYLQDWLIDEVESDSGNQKLWRKDPKYTGISNCVGDIGSHIEFTVKYMTGLEVSKVASIMDKYGQQLDMNAHIMVEYDSGAHGIYSCSQVCIGNYNGLRIRIFGTKASLEWFQETPDQLIMTKKDGSKQILARGKMYLGQMAKHNNRLPSGHPEGFVLAFANIYSNYMDAIRKKINGWNYEESDLDFPQVEDGLGGVKFISAVVSSHNNESKWTALYEV